MTPELKQYLTSWLAWAERGAPDGEPYSREYGLCYSVGRYTLIEELELMFYNDRLDDDYPFGFEDYYNRHEKNTQHECPKRLAWVKKKLDIAA